MSLLSLRGLFTGTGWRPDSELSGTSWKDRIGGKEEPPTGGIPVLRIPYEDDTTALGADLWQEIDPSFLRGVSSSSSSSSKGDGSTWWPLSPSSNIAPAGLAGTGKVGDPSSWDFTRNDFICHSLSSCQPCPPSKRNHPFCRPYGNRRLVSCKAAAPARPGRRDIPPGLAGQAGQVKRAAKPSPPAGLEFHGWEACGKVIAAETRDYLEFVMILVLLGLGSLVLLVRRNRELLKLHQTVGRSSTARRRRARVG